MGDGIGGRDDYARNGGGSEVMVYGMIMGWRDLC